MLFIARQDKLRRLRVNGEATVRDEDLQMAEIVGATRRPRRRAGNFSELSALHPPRPGGDAAEPAWKEFADRKEYVHPRRPTFRGGSE